ncbi:tripartite tricarboxylate transporter permease [Halocatena marina]|uniref:tripartite tricarboxylate transporter permease n=1 Tax=Halocatena marina TaxID=2934937 RepID=UPI002010B5E6|nr:tripartite tricarboxylate transporter permease [Halocatena marina]
MIIENLLAGFGNILTPFNLLLFAVAITLGMLSGAIPGMNGTMTVVLMIPITYVLEPAAGIMMLSVIYVGAVYAGSISAILFKVPGAPEAIMTTLDGYPMNQQGKLREAISTAVFASAFGGIVGTLILTFFSPMLAEFAIQLSDPEFFAVILLGLALVSTIGAGNVTKATMMMSLGLFLGVFGFDPLTGMTRFTFGSNYLASGINFIPVILGVFAFSEVLKQIQSGGSLIGTGDDSNLDNTTSGSIFPPLGYFKRFSRILSVNSVLGTLIGVLPGAGATTGALFGYTFGQRLVPKRVREKFGTGVPEGVAAPETANNAACSGAFVPLLTLGIPGSATTAVILAAFILHGIRPGPSLISTQGPLVYTIFAALLMANVAILLMNKPIVRMFLQVRHIPRELLLTLIMVFTVVGAFATRNIVVDIWTMMIFGIAGYYLEKYNYSVAPMVIGLVLGPLAEPSLRRSLTKASGDWMVFLNRPISAVLIILAILTFIIPLIMDSTQFGDRIRDRLGLAGVEQ